MEFNYNRYVKDFNQYLYYLKNLSHRIKLLDGKNQINNKDLAIAAKRISVPEPFKAFVDLIEKKTGITFPTNLRFTIEEVTQSDLEQISDYQIKNFKFDNLNKDLLLKSAYLASVDLFIINPRNQRYGFTPFSQSAESYPNDSSSGYPVFRKKGTEVARKDAISWCNSFISNPSLTEILSQPTAVFHRFQYKFNLSLSKLEKKVRQVWGVSFRVSTLEGYFFRDMVNSTSRFCQYLSVPPATWGNTMKKNSDMLPHFRSYKKNIISVDVSKFDANVPSYMWPLFYATARQCLSFESDEQKLAFKHLMAFHCYTPFCFQDTKIRYQYKGVPSGSLITSLFDTFVTRTIVNYACLEYTNGKYSAGQTSTCLGDDNLIVELHVSFKHLVSVYKRFGMKVNEKKSGVYKYYQRIEFLGYIWDEQNRPTQDKQWYIAHYCLPSRFLSRTSGKPISFLQTCRAISISMVLYKGIEMFEYLIGWGDFVWKDLLRQLKELDEDPMLIWIDEDRRKHTDRVPLKLILVEGWEAF